MEFLLLLFGMGSEILVAFYILAESVPGRFASNFIKIGGKL